MTKEERKQYYLDNKETINEKAKQYYLDNKEKRKQYKLNNKERIRENRKKYRLDNKEAIDKYNEQYKLNNKEKIRENDKQYRLDNKEKIAEYYLENKERIIANKKQYRLDNKEAIAEYYLSNKERIIETSRKYQNNRRKTDPLFKLSCNIRRRTRKAFKSKGLAKKNTTRDMLGCTFDFMQDHLVKQFTKGMTLENYGEWHIDHIKPLVSAENEQELIKLAHYTNLQPLWAEDNFKKGSKING